MADPTGVLINIGIQLLLRVIIAALTPKQNTEGPRLEDRQITTSTYGDTIPIGYGTTLLGGNIIWGREIREVATTEEIGKGDLFSLGTNTTYTYFLTCAVAIARREARQLIRIYADGKIIYDAEGGPVEEMQGLNFRFYTGSATQNPDPTIASDYPPGETPAYRGTCYIVFDDIPIANFGNRVPQFRFVVAFASENLIAPFISFPNDNVLPNGLVDYDQNRRVCYVAEAGTVGFLTFGPPYLLRMVDADTGASISTLNFASFVSQASFAPEGQDAVNLAAVWNTNGQYASSISGGDSPYLVLMQNDEDFLCIIKDTLSVGGSSTPRTGSAPATGFPCNNSYEWIDPATNLKRIYMRGGGGQLVVEVIFITARFYFYLTCDDGIFFTTMYKQNRGSFGGNTQRGSMSLHFLPNLSLSWDNTDSDFTENHGVLGVCQGAQDPANGYTEVFVACRTGATVFTGNVVVYRLKINRFGGVIYNKTSFDGTFYLTGFAAYPVVMQYDSETDVLVIQGRRPSGGSGDGITTGVAMNTNLSAAFPEQAERLWTRTDLGDGTQDHADGGQFRVIGGEILRVKPGTNGLQGEWITVDPKTGQTIKEYDIPGGYVYLNGVQWEDQFGDRVSAAIGPVRLWDSKRKRLLQPEGPFDAKVGWGYLQAPAVRGTETLEDVVEDICLRSRLKPSQIDATDLSSVFVKGYAIAKQLTYRAALEPLATAYNFYAVEKDGKLFFLLKSDTSDETILEDDFISGEEGSAFEEMIVQAAELPRAVFVQYRSSEFKDELSTQGARRITTPEETVTAVGEFTTELPLVLSDAEAMAIAERLLFESWVAREGFKFPLPQRHLKLLPNDVITVTAQGRSETIRIDRLSIGSDLTMEIEGRTTGGGVYNAAIEAVGSIGSPNFGRKDGVIDAYPRAATGLVFDVPLLFDEALAGRDSGSLMLFAAGLPAYQPNGKYAGAALAVSYDNGAFATRAVSAVNMAWGLVSSAIPDIPDPNFNSIQDAYIDVQVYSGASSFTSVSQADLIGADANTAILIAPSTGKVEVIGFRDAEELVDAYDTTIYRLSKLWRGKRGTNTLAKDWAGPVYLVIMNTSWVSGFIEPNSRNDTTVTYKTVPSGVYADSVTPYRITYEHRSLMPYAPAHVRGAFNTPSPGDVTISWVRRTRQGGHWAPFTGTVPLAEDTEAYQIDILDGPGGDVLRTLSATSTSVVYTDAMADVDFGTNVPNTLYVRVYQMSAQVGRGFSYEAALTP